MGTSFLPGPIQVRISSFPPSLSTDLWWWPVAVSLRYCYSVYFDWNFVHPPMNSCRYSPPVVSHAVLRDNSKVRCSVWSVHGQLLCIFAPIVSIYNTFCLNNEAAIRHTILVVMILRLWAMYDRSKIILSILLISYLGEIIPSIISSIVESNPKNLVGM